MKVRASYHQERLWFIHRFEAGNLYDSSPIYHNIPLILEIDGPLQIDLLEQSLQELINRHEVLRTRIIDVDSQPFQLIEPQVNFKLEVIRWQESYRGTGPDNPVNFALKAVKRPFLLDRDLLIRGLLIGITTKKYILAISIHHIISDRYSLGILAKELLEHYEAGVQKRSPRLTKLSLHYADFSQWQQEFPPKMLESLLFYWKRQLGGHLQPLELPTDNPRSSIHMFHAERQSFRLPPELSRRIQSVSRQKGVNNFIVLLAALKVLFHRYSGQDEIIVGTSADNRRHPGTASIVGPVANLLVLRSQLSPNSLFDKLLADLDKTVKNAIKHQDMPFDQLVQQLNPAVDMSRTALFDVLFQYIEKPGHLYQKGNLAVQVVETNLGWGKYDLNFYIEGEETFSGVLVYNRKYYNASTISRLIAHYKILLEILSRETSRRISTLSFLTEEEHYQLLIGWNQTQALYPKDKTLHQIFEEQAEQTPDHIALVGQSVNEERSALCAVRCAITYRELNEKSNQLAQVLGEKGLHPDTIAAIMMEPSVEMIIGILGILKSGGAYLPIDPEYPEERINYMLKDSSAKILVTDTGLPEKLSIVNCQLSIINYQREIACSAQSNSPLDCTKFGGGGGCLNLQTAANPANLAYIIYTSGTTGKPKGCMITHGNVVRLLKNDKFPYHFGTGDVWPMVHSFCFDFSVWEMYGALLYGGRLILPDRASVQDTGVLLSMIKVQKVTVLNQTPSSFYHLLEEEKKSGHKSLDKHLRLVVFGGERLEPHYLKDWTDYYSLTDIRLINMYGITETTVHVTYYKIKEKDIHASGKGSPIGTAIPETTLYICDRDLNLVPVGVVGEMYVGGTGVARGYLNRVRLTTRRFIKNPHKEREIIYKTGDLARWSTAGGIEYIGRNDAQVKIRGYRVELGEIENRLSAHEEITEAVVVANRKGEDKYSCLYAYFVSHKDLNISGLRGYLSRQLPGYMIPSYFVQMARLPLTSNGKIDKKALPEPDVTVKPEEYEPPHSQIEKKLVEIWSEILSIEKDKIGIKSNFFEWGGHSLKATTLISDIHKVFDVKITLVQVFMAPVLRDLAHCIETAKQDKYASIQPIEKKSYYPLSSAQKRMYLLQQMELENINYNISIVVVLAGEIDRETFAGTFHRLIKRHESLRTSFHMIENEPLQKIHDEVEFDIDFYRAGENEVREIVKRYIKAFDLGKAPLFRVGLVDEASDTEKHILMVEMHHIISDGVSDSILIREFMAFYGKEKLAPLRLQYKDYSEWQNRLVRQGEIKQQENYWLKVFAGEIPVLNVPTDYPRPESQSFQGEALKVEIGSAETRAMHQLVLKEEATLFILLLALLNILLAKISCDEDIVVGTPIVGRRHSDLKEIIGMFVNTLALRNRPESHKTFKTFLREVRESTLKAYENQEYPFENLVEKVVVNRDASRNPLFDTILVLQNMDRQKIRIPGLQLMPYNYKNKITKFDLTLSCLEAGKRLFLTFGYCTKLFKGETIGRFSNYFKKIVSMILNRPGIRLREIEIISEEEKKQLLYDFNDTAASYPEDKTIRQLFEEQVERTPEHIAVVGPSERKYRAYMTHMTYISYRELSRKSLHLASLLRQRGIEADTIVGVMLERSLEMITCLLGILKAGGAYLPIDPDYPGDRIDYMLADSDSKILVTRQDLSKELKFEKEIIDLSDAINRVPTPPHLHLPPAPATSLAYVIYTSGTTGSPKGALIENRNVVRLLFNDEFQFDFDSTDVWTLFHSFCFDFSVWEMYGALLYGGKLIVIPAIVTKDPEQYLEVLKKEKVTVLNQTPPAFDHLDEKDKELKNPGKSLYLKYVIFGGEALNPLKLKDWHARYPQTKLINMFGITETTVHVTFKEITADDIKLNKSNIGKPIPTLTTYILDRNLKLLPIGVAGELCVGGAGVGRGYLNRPELTAEKFLSFFYRSYKSYMTYIPKKIYKSGDLARWLTNGEMEYLGRIDHQVKIRGFRIEPAEIESNLIKHAKIKDAVVIAREGADEDWLLCAYIVPHSLHGSNALEVSELREYLALRLADYMIPSYFIKLEKIPLTVNGKVYRKKLPAVDPVIGDNYAAPRDKLEEKLVEIWSEVLQIKKELIGIDSDFFHLGGHSLKATRLLTKIHKELQVKIPLKEIFTASTVRELARCLEAVAEHKFIPVNITEKKEYYPLSSAQQRLYFMHRLDPGNTGYNVPTVVLLQGNTSKEKLENNFNRLINRHENLRTSFEMVGSEVVQKIREEADLKIEYHEASEEEAKKIVNGFIKPFDLSKKLLRAGLITIAKRKHVFMVDMHHIISDAVSLNIIITELTALDRGKETLPPLKIQYKDYSEWQNKWLQAGGEKIQEEYWLKQFPGEIPLLTLPTDYARPEMRSYEGSKITFTLSKQETRHVNTLARETQSTLFMVLSALFSVLLSKISGQEDIIIGTTVEGRRHEDLAWVIGIFVNILALRQYPKKEKTFVQFLNEVKENTLAAFENQEYPFDNLVEKLAVNRDTSRSPLFDVMFQYRANEEKQGKTNSLKVKPFEYGVKKSKLDLTLWGAEAREKLFFSLEYSTTLFKESTIRCFIDYFKEIVKVVSEDPAVMLADLEIVPEAKKQEILAKYGSSMEEEGYYE